VSGDPTDREPLVLVTGGAGFIGVHTVARLLDEGRRVRVLDDLRTGRREHLPRHPALEFVRGDVRDPALLARVLEGVSHVLHLAAQVSVEHSLRDPVDSCSENILGFVTVLAAAHRARARVVYASAAAV
jgi:UDP-glucose 4-epimerase